MPLIKTNVSITLCTQVLRILGLQLTTWPDLEHTAQKSWKTVSAMVRQNGNEKVDSEQFGHRMYPGPGS